VGSLGVIGVGSAAKLAAVATWPRKFHHVQCHQAVPQQRIPAVGLTVAGKDGAARPVVIDGDRRSAAARRPRGFKLVLVLVVEVVVFCARNPFHHHSIPS